MADFGQIWRLWGGNVFCLPQSDGGNPLTEQHFPSFRRNKLHQGRIIPARGDA
jgi:hypothetical protein